MVFGTLGRALGSAALGTAAILLPKRKKGENPRSPPSNSRRNDTVFDKIDRFVPPILFSGWAVGVAAVLAEASGVFEFVEARLRRGRGTKPAITDLPNDVLVSIFAAVEDPLWVRHTVPLVCKEWRELYRSRDASPLHEMLEVDFRKEVERAVETARRERRRWGRRRRRVEGPPRRFVVHASRIILWAARRAGSVSKLRFTGGYRGALGDFSAEDLGALVAVVGSFLTEISIRSPMPKQCGLGELCKRPFWESLRTSVAPAGRLRSLVVEGIDSAVGESDLEALGRLAGSLEELVLETLSCGVRFVEGLPRFPESLCALKELRQLILVGHAQITAIPAGISSLKKLEVLSISSCNLSSLPKELGELSQLTRLSLSYHRNMGNLPQDEAFPAELGKMKSLLWLFLFSCGLRTVPAFIGELESLEVLVLPENEDLQIDAPLDFLIEGCPRLRQVLFVKAREWTPESLAHLEAFKVRLRAKNPDAEVFL